MICYTHLQKNPVSERLAPLPEKLREIRRTPIPA